MLKDIGKRILWVAIVVFVMMQIISLTCIDWIMFHPGMGTGPAVELASTKEVGGLVLEAPFLSAPRVLTRVRLLLNDPFPSARRVYNGIGCPMMIIHGTDDTVIPFAHGERLHQLSCLRPCGYSRRFVPVEGADHTEIPDVLGTTDYLELIAGFAEADNEHYVKLGWRQWLRHYDIM